jgi:hypothetical protein
MKKINRYYLLFLLTPAFFAADCSKKNNSNPVPEPSPAALLLTEAKFDNTTASTNTNYNIRTGVSIKLLFNNVLDKATVQSAIAVKENGITTIPLNFTYQNNDSTVIVTLQTPLKNLTRYSATVSALLQSVKKGKLNAGFSIQFITQIDSSNKFPLISDNTLLDTIQKRTFKYFWDYGHPISGLARERSNATPETVTSGGSGFGIMAIPAAVNRNFITRVDGLARMQKITSFLKNTAQKFHGAFSHWLNGTTGAVIPFSPKDDGGDLVETSYLMAGLLTARQYFNGTDIAETTLRNDITALYNNVEWDWYRNGGQNVLYWHWSPNYNWQMNFAIKGWNECLITYVLAAASPTHGIPVAVYSNGWTANGTNGFTNGNTYYTYQLPLGPQLGGPLFFSHYSFLGINPNGLSDVYANYQTQTKNHSLINYEYCKTNPNGNFGYSDNCWGLTASDINNGYTASSPTNDVGVIAPTAALSSFPYTPNESMKALKFFYYVLGDKIFKEYGFADAFSLNQLWYANSFLAIDQGPIIVMIENYRSQLIWNLFTSCPEVKNGMKNVLGFTAPYL